MLENTKMLHGVFTNRYYHGKIYSHTINFQTLKGYLTTQYHIRANFEDR